MTQNNRDVSNDIYVYIAPPVAKTSTRKAGRQAYVTATPETAPPVVICESCEKPLTFIHATIGRVQPVERWDSYASKRCGTGFEYRHRTRRLRRIP
jgi:hypothetical protein